MSDRWNVEQVLDNATHSSVTRRRLTGTKRGRIGLLQKVGFLRGWLYDKPLIEYLNDDEVVEYLFVSPNPVVEIAAGQEHEISPQNRYSTIVAITNNRILLVIARKPSNDKREIQYPDVLKYKIYPMSNLTIDTRRDGTPKEPSTGLRFEFETPDRTVIWQSGPTQSFSLSEVTEHLVPTLRGRTQRAEWANKQLWLNTRQEFQKSIDEHEQWLGKIAKRANKAESSSVTQSRLRSIWEQLNQQEQPHYYTTGREHRHQITRSQEQNPTEVYDHLYAVFSNHRMLIQNENARYEIDYSEITDFSVNERIRNPDGSNETVIQVDIEMPNEYHILDVSSLSQSQLSSLIKFIDRMTNH